MPPEFVGLMTEAQFAALVAARLTNRVCVPRNLPTQLLVRVGTVGCDLDWWIILWDEELWPALAGDPDCLAMHPERAPDQVVKAVRRWLRSTGGDT